MDCIILVDACAWSCQMLRVFDEKYVERMKVIAAKLRSALMQVGRWAMPSDTVSLQLRRSVGSPIWLSEPLQCVTYKKVSSYDAKSTSLIEFRHLRQHGCLAPISQSSSH